MYKYQKREHLISLVISRKPSEIPKRDRPIAVRWAMIKTPDNNN